MKNLFSVFPGQLLSIALVATLIFSCKTKKDDDVIKKETALLVAPQISLTSVISSGLSAPMQFVHAGDGSKRIFIVQKAGTIRVYDSTFNFLSVFGTVSNVSTSGERGLLSLAFHPNYSTNGFLYVYYTNTAGNLELARYHVNSGSPNTLDAASKVIVLTIPHPTNSNHNGGELHFGTDGYLYLSTGDGGGAGDVPNNAQNTAVLLGKILRLNVNTSATAPYYAVPAGNPFSNEVYAYGLRNPYRWSFDKATQDMWIGDVGQDSWEEINFRAAASTLGTNYGWRCYEGNATYNAAGCTGTNYIFPVHAYTTQNPAASITGGVVYRGTTYPALQGVCLSADFYSGVFYKIVPNGSGWDVTTQTLSPTGIVDFGETESGEVYVVSNTGNSVFRVTSN
jgi:glucose/arabinose dehydrogenase